MAKAATERATAAEHALRWAVRLLVLGFVGAMLGVIAILLVVPRATDARTLTVLTGSMTPALPVGSLVLVRPVDPRSLEVGDIATYRVGEDTLVTHRVASIDSSTVPNRFVFKGDANRGPDTTPISAEDVVGEVWFDIPYLGSIRDGLSGRAGLTMLGVLALAAYSAFQLSGARADRRRARDGGGRTSGPTTVDRSLIVATLDAWTVTTLGLTPDGLAERLGGVVLDRDADTFRLLIVPLAGGEPATISLLQSVHPTSLEVVEGPVRLTGQAPSAAVTAALEDAPETATETPAEGEMPHVTTVTT